jgi:hypothetical protein
LFCFPLQSKNQSKPNNQFNDSETKMLDEDAALAMFNQLMGAPDEPSPKHQGPAKLPTQLVLPLTRNLTPIEQFTLRPLNAFKRRIKTGDIIVFGAQPSLGLDFAHLGLVLANPDNTEELMVFEMRTVIRVDGPKSDIPEAEVVSTPMVNRLLASEEDVWWLPIKEGLMSTDASENMQFLLRTKARHFDPNKVAQACSLSTKVCLLLCYVIFLFVCGLAKLAVGDSSYVCAYVCELQVDDGGKIRTFKFTQNELADLCMVSFVLDSLTVVELIKPVDAKSITLEPVRKHLYEDPVLLRDHDQIMIFSSLVETTLNDLKRQSTANPQADPELHDRVKYAQELFAPMSTKLPTRNAHLSRKELTIFPRGDLKSIDQKLFVDDAGLRWTRKRGSPFSKTVKFICQEKSFALGGLGRYMAIVHSRSIAVDVVPQGTWLSNHYDYRDPDTCGVWAHLKADKLPFWLPDSSLKNVVHKEPPKSRPMSIRLPLPVP